MDSLAPPADTHNPFKFKTKVMAGKLQSLLNTQVSTTAVAVTVVFIEYWYATARLHKA